MIDVLRISYWALAVLFIGFGSLAIFTIGMPFLATGIALVALAPSRDRPGVFWPWLAGVLAFFVGYVVVVPFACSAQEIATTSSGNGSGAVEAAGGDVACTNLLGIDYTGGPGYNPPRWPAAIAGGATALGAGFGTRIVLSKRLDHSGRGRPAGRD